MEPRKELTWMTREHEHVQRSTDWYWILGVVAVAGFVASVLLDNTLFGILILIAAGMLAYLSMKPPEEVTVSITERGIFINDMHYPYRKIKAFWVETDTGTPILLFVTDRFFIPQISIPIGDAPPEDIRFILRTYLKEEHLRESSTHKFMETLGF